MSNERLEFLRLWYYDLAQIELRWLDIQYCPPIDGIPYTKQEYRQILIAVKAQMKDIEREIQGSKENLA